MSRGAATLVLTVALASAAGCVRDPLEEEVRREIGETDHHVPQEDGDYGVGPLHRPGQPCLTCHSFALAGTVYRRASDAVGLEGAEVAVTDAEGRSFAVRTNAAGTFIVLTRRGLDAPRYGEHDKLFIPFRLAYPLEVEVRHGDLIRTMRSRIHREGSCATCHGPLPGAASVGHIYLEEELP